MAQDLRGFGVLESERLHPHRDSWRGRRAAASAAPASVRCRPGWLGREEGRSSPTGQYDHGFVIIMAEPIGELPFRSRFGQSSHNFLCSDELSRTFDASSRRVWCDGRCRGSRAGIRQHVRNRRASQGVGRPGQEGPGASPARSATEGGPPGTGAAPAHCVGFAAPGNPGRYLPRAAPMREDVVLSFYGPSRSKPDGAAEKFGGDSRLPRKWR